MEVVIWYFKETTKGNKRLTSTSKIRNTIPNKKKRREKGIRAVSLGSKPHSKGVFLLRDWMTCNLISKITPTRNKTINIARLIYITIQIILTYIYKIIITLCPS